MKTNSLDDFLKKHSLEELYDLSGDQLVDMYKKEVMPVISEALSLMAEYESSLNRHKIIKGNKKGVDAFSKEVSVFSVLVLTFTKERMAEHTEACSSILQLVQNYYTQLVYLKQNQDSVVSLRMSLILWMLSLVFSVFLAKCCENENKAKGVFHKEEAVTNETLPKMEDTFICIQEMKDSLAAKKTVEKK